MRDINITLQEEIYRGDSIDIYCEINDDLTGYLISAEIYDSNYFLVGKTYTNEIPSGINSQIEMIDWEQGEFVIHVPAGDTSLLRLNAYLKIVLSKDNELATVYNKKLNLKALKEV